MTRYNIHELFLYDCFKLIRLNGFNVHEKGLIQTDVLVHCCNFNFFIYDSGKCGKCRSNKEK